jgi:hypothetical protein
VWLAYTPEAFSPDLASHLPSCCHDAAQFLQFNGSFFLAAVYSLYYVALEPVAGLSWTGAEWWLGKPAVLVFTNQRVGTTTGWLN